MIKKRLLQAIPLLFGITIVSFFIMHLAPGDPSTIFAGPNTTPQDLANLKAAMGLDKPILIQYFYWLKGVLTGNLGYSFETKKPVLSAILERLPATLMLSMSALFLIILITLPLGIYSGKKAGKWQDRFIAFFSFFGLSLPSFWVGLMVIIVFSLKLDWFPSQGYLSPEYEWAPAWIKAGNIMHHMVLPLLTILVGGLADLTRYHRAGVIQIQKMPFIEAARARQISEFKVYAKHVLKNACLPLITILGLSLPGLVSGSFVIEYIFSWPGMGQLGIGAVFSRDYPILMGMILMSSVLILVGNLLADIAYSLLDPRIQS